MWTRKAANLRGWLLLLIIASSLVVVTLLSQSKISVDKASLQPAGTSLCIMIATAWICARRGFLRWALVMETLSVGVALSVLALISSYLATSQSLPLADLLLLSGDRLLGFDGAAFIRWVDSHPWLAWSLMQAYASFAFQLVLLPPILILTGRVASGFGLVLSYAIICFAASIISIWFPAVAANVTYGIDGTTLNSINAQFGFAFLEQFHAVRDHSQFVFSLERAQGILTFPSVHTATAVICAFSMFTVPWLRYPILVLNIGMAVSTLSHGGHYLVDVIAGAILAVLALWLTRYLAEVTPPILRWKVRTASLNPPSQA